MRALLQRVSSASVTVGEARIAKISRGLLIFLGIHDKDNIDDIEWLTSKIIGMRIFEDENRRMNLSLQDIQGSICIVSQFTLFAKNKKGNRPSFIDAAQPKKATELYEKFIEEIKNYNLQVETGEFGAMMKVELVNDGPVTIWLDTHNKE